MAPTADAAPGNAAAHAAAADNDVADNAASADTAAVSPADDSPTEAKLRERYASHMDIVKLGLDAWKEIGLLYAEWRSIYLPCLAGWEFSTKQY